jgi:hypothetical protein
MRSSPIFSIKLRTNHFALPFGNAMLRERVKARLRVQAPEGLTVVAHQSAREYRPVDCKRGQSQIPSSSSPLAPVVQPRRMSACCKRQLDSGRLCPPRPRCLGSIASAITRDGYGPTICEVLGRPWVRKASGGGSSPCKLTTARAVQRCASPWIGLLADGGSRLPPLQLGPPPPLRRYARHPHVLAHPPASLDWAWACLRWLR